MASGDRAYLTVIWIICFFSYACVGISIPSFPFRLQKILPGDLPDDAVSLSIILTLSAGILLFIAPLIGHLGDRYGHRKILQAKLACGAVGFIVSSVAGSFLMLLLSHLLVMALALVPVSCFSMFAACVRPQNKVRTFGYLNAARMGGYVVGTGLGGGLYQWDVVSPFYVGLMMSLAAFFIVSLLLQEKRVSGPIDRFNLITDSHLALLWSVARTPVAVFLLLLFLAVQTGEQMIESNWDYYSSLKFDWTPADLSVFLLTVYLLVTLIVAVVLDPLVRAVGEAKTLMIGFLSGAVGMFGFAMADSTMIVYLFVLFWAVKALVGPVCQAILSNTVSIRHQGKLQGALISVTSLAIILTNTLFTEIFFIFSSDCGMYCFPGAPYLVIGIIFILCLVIVYMRRRNLIFMTKIKTLRIIG